jgi:hypothetical protein
MGIVAGLPGGICALHSQLENPHDEGVRPPQMFIYTTCRRCGGLLQVTDNDTVHHGCTPKPTKAERLAQEWMAALEAGDIEREAPLQAQIDEIDRRGPRLLDAALRYAAWGWPVFPLKPLSLAVKDQLPYKAAKRPGTPHGFKDATTDPDQIRRWWGRNPDSNIGTPTGLTFDVIDIDVPDGPHSFAEMIARENPMTAHGLIPDVHGQVATASGGLHLYIPPSSAGNSAEIMPGIDYRGDGGYVVIPPSTLWEPHRAYSWISAPSPTVIPVRAMA